MLIADLIQRSKWGGGCCLVHGACFSICFVHTKPNSIMQEIFQNRSVAPFCQILLVPEVFRRHKSEGTIEPHHVAQKRGYCKIHCALGVHGLVISLKVGWAC